MPIYANTLYATRVITDAVLNRLSGKIPSVMKLEGFMHPAVLEIKSIQNNGLQKHYFLKIIS